MDWLNMFWNPHKAYVEISRKRDLLGIAVTAVLLVAVLSAVSVGVRSQDASMGLVIAIMQIIGFVIFAGILYKIGDIITSGKTSYLKMLTIIGVSYLPIALGGLLLTLFISIGGGMIGSILAPASDGSALLGLCFILVGAVVGMLFVGIGFASIIQGIKKLHKIDTVDSWTILLIVVGAMVNTIFMVYVHLLPFILSSRVPPFAL